MGGLPHRLRAAEKRKRKQQKRARSRKGNATDRQRKNTRQTYVSEWTGTEGASYVPPVDRDDAIVQDFLENVDKDLLSESYRIHEDTAPEASSSAADSLVAEQMGQRLEERSIVVATQRGAEGSEAVTIADDAESAESSGLAVHGWALRTPSTRSGTAEALQSTVSYVLDMWQAVTRGRQQAALVLAPSLVRTWVRTQAPAARSPNSRRQKRLAERRSVVADATALRGLRCLRHAALPGCLVIIDYKDHSDVLLADLLRRVRISGSPGRHSLGHSARQGLGAPSSSRSSTTRIPMEPISVRIHENPRTGAVTTNVVGRHHTIGDRPGSTAAAAIPSWNRGYVMLRRLGWTEGDGLGKLSDGIVDPLDGVALAARRSA